LDWLEEQGIGRRQTAYKLRDWLISRQRYWGAPIPIVYCPNCGEVPLPEDQLPLELPDIKNIQPKGQAPLASDPDFVNTTCPRCSGSATRETDTMDGFVDNSWYYFRYLDPHNSRQFCGPVQLQHWMPVDLYVGGAEHTVGHLTYSRFFTKVLHDQGFVNFPEPFLKLRHPGIVLAEDGRKMSKRWDNVIDPNQVVKLHGADSVRLYEMFMGPFSDSIPWSSQGLIGCRRFLDKVWRLCHDPQKTSSSTTSPQLLPHLHRLIQKVGDDIPDFKFNTAISSMMEFINLWSGEGEHLNLHDARKFLLILAPFAPHITEELWQHLNLTRNSKPETRNHKSIHQHSWPEFAKDLTTEEQVEIPVQVNGKLRATLQLATRNSQLETKVKELALADPKVVKWTTGKTIVKTIFVPGKLINFVVE
jgi:leucyl-tRNA synthetase